MMLIAEFSSAKVLQFWISSDFSPLSQYWSALIFLRPAIVFSVQVFSSSFIDSYCICLSAIIQPIDTHHELFR